MSFISNFSFWILYFLLPLLHSCPCFSLAFYLASAKHQLPVHLWPFEKLMYCLGNYKHSFWRVVFSRVFVSNMRWRSLSKQISNCNWSDWKSVFFYCHASVSSDLPIGNIAYFYCHASVSSDLPIAHTLVSSDLIGKRFFLSRPAHIWAIWTSWHPLATAGILGMIGTRASHSSWRSYCRTCHIVVHTFSVVKAGRKVPGGVTSYPQVEAWMCYIHWVL